MPSDQDFLDTVASPRFCVRLFAHIPDVVFCLKDKDHRYRAANTAFAARLGLDDPSALLGRTAEDFFPPALAAAYREQDQEVLDSGREMSDRLELISNRDGTLGWFLATKVPLHDAGNNVIGLASISRDLQTPSNEDLEFAGVAKIVDYIQQNLEADLRAEDLGAKIGLSAMQLDRRMRKVYQLTTAQFIRKARIGMAAKLLTTTDQPITEVAFACGYSDQSAFTRQFRSTVGLPPAAYRESNRIRD